MPTYLPPSPPATYAAPYVAASATVPAQPYDPATGMYAPAAGTPYAAPGADTGSAAYTPWPMSPAARAAQAAAQAAAAAPAASNPAAASPRETRAPSKKSKLAHQTALARNTATAVASDTQTAQRQTVYPAQPDNPAYANPAYANQAAAQPYIPQPPGYAAPYYTPTQVAQANQANGSYNAMSGNVANAQTLSVAEDLAQINREQSSTISGGMVFRNRSGENGLSNLADIELPIEGSIKAGNGHIVIIATPVTLDAGTADTEKNTLARFGSGGGAALSTNINPTTGLSSTGTNNYGSQSSTGVGLSVGYDTDKFKVDVGTTPAGFVEQNIVGGVQYKSAVTDNVSYSMEVARRAVTDSLLSYAGTRDAGANLKWGGVTSDGTLAALSWDDGINGLYVNAAFQFLTGANVDRNTAVKGGGGVYTRLIKDADQTVTVGVNTTVMGYDKNLSYFTYGQGGYFSPQQYVILNVPVEWTGRDGLFTYDFKGSFGVQHYRENSSLYYPTNGTMQSAAVTAGLTPDANAIYPGQSKTGFSYNFDAVGEYQLAPQLAVGAMASVGNAYQYSEWIAAVYLRYSFSKQSGAQPFPPAALASPYLSLSN